MTVNAEVRAAARIYLPWAAVTPVLGVICFQFDGIFTGAMATKDMRNMMIVSLAVFMLAWWLLEAPFGNHGLWAALNIFFVARGMTFFSRMGALERRAFRVKGNDINQRRFRHASTFARVTLSPSRKIWEARALPGAR